MKLLFLLTCIYFIPAFTYAQIIRNRIDTTRKITVLEKGFADTAKKPASTMEKTRVSESINKDAQISTVYQMQPMTRDTVPGRTNIMIKHTEVKTIEVRTVNGVLKDKNGTPIPGASITIKGTTKGFQTDQNGRFSIRIDKDDKLNVNIIGYTHFELDPNQTNVTINGYNVQSSQNIVHNQSTTTTESPLNVFPIPYPVPSSIYNLPLVSINKIRFFYQADSILSDGLSKCSYDQKRYYYIPHGFALVTQMEQIEEDGTSLKPPERWSSKIAGNFNDPLDYIMALFTSQKGYFRVLVFLFTDIDLSSNNSLASEDEARKWLNTGYTDLPGDLKRTVFTKNHRCTLLVYHYSKKQGSDGKMLSPSEISGQNHFIKSKLIDYIK